MVTASPLAGPQADAVDMAGLTEVHTVITVLTLTAAAAAGVDVEADAVAAVVIHTPLLVIGAPTLGDST